SQLFYQCQISITIKDPNAECERPQCPEPQGFGATKTGAGRAAPAAVAAPRETPAPAQLRLLKKRAAGFENTLDVRAEISALDIQEKEQQLPDEMRMISPLMVMPSGICLSPFGFSVLIAASVSLIAASVVLASYSFRTRTNFKV
ncbi:hypothetical protein OESDEN_12292, partial [Oesophagostomum dentatum]